MVEPIVFETKAEKLVQALSLLSGSGGVESLFKPLKLVVRDGIVATATSSSGGSAFVVGAAKNLNVEGKGSLVIDPDILISRLGLFPPDEKIRWTVFPDKYELVGKVDHITYYPVDESNCLFYDKLAFVVKDDRMHYKGGTVAPTTDIYVHSEELAKFRTRASLLPQDYRYYHFHFSADGGSWGLVGNYVNRDHTPIKTAINCRVEGESMEVIVADGFAELVGVMDGEWRLSGRSQAPLWMFKETEEYKIGYQVAPRISR
jgi:hypothetical protein